MLIFSFGLVVLFIPGLPSAATTPRWVFIAIVTPLLLIRAAPTVVTVGHALGAAFLAWGALSLLWAFNVQDGLHDLWKFVVLGIVFWLGSAQNNLRAVLVGMGLGLAVNSAVVVAQFYGWGVLPQTAAPGGLFFNKNFGGELAAMVLAGLVAERLWWLVPGLLPTIVLCQSRGGMIALGVAAIAALWHCQRRLAVLVAASVVALGGYLWFTADSAAQRRQLWLDIWDGMQFWGKGIGAFFLSFPEHATRIDALALRPSQAHNDMLQLTYELGPGALFAAGLLVFALRGARNTAYYVLIVFLVEGLVGFPLYMPATAFLAAFVLGQLCRGRDCLWSAGTWSRFRVFLGQSSSRLAGAGAVSFAPRASAVPLRSQYSCRAGLFFYRGASLRSAQERHTSH